MVKSKEILSIVAAFFIIFYLNNISFAEESTELKNKYPDYTYEFSGKDTFEKFNRKIFFFNQKLNKYVIRPVNVVWASILPKYAMARVRNVCTNIEFPVRFTSCLLQKDFKSSGKETVRFLTNTTIGLGGLYDPATSYFKIESSQEDIGQVLAHYNIKKGPYLVLPIIPPGNVRGLVGELLDCSLNPSFYIINPIVMMAKGGLLINRTTDMQSIFTAIGDNYADPYEITKKLYAVDNYIKSSNLDRKEVLDEKSASKNMIKVSDVSGNPDLKADVELNSYNPQCPIVDSMRTALFDVPNLDDSIWSEMSVWNRSFREKIKTSSVKLDNTHPNCKYRYILQKNKKAPLAILYPSIGEGIMSHHPIVMAKIFYDEGYSVVIQGSTFQWEFIKSMPENYRPGIPAKDADCARMVTAKILKDLSDRKDCSFDEKILVGTSFGALTTLFVAAKEEVDNTLGISNYISINPPVEIFFALKQLDKISQEWEKNPDELKLKAAITAQKIIQVCSDISNDDAKNKDESLPFTDDEAKLITSFIMKQKLSDLVFTIEKSAKCKSELYKTINNMNYYDYAQKYLLVGQYESYDKLNYDTSLYSLTNFLQENKKYKIYHSVDDYFVSQEQLVWLKKQSNNKSVFFSNGSHMGFLYRKEFIDEFKKDISLQKTALNDTK